jgi:hypothetical protein
MDERLDEILAKLQRIQQLWTEVQRMKQSDPEYKPLLENIRVLSAEYQALIEGSEKPEKPK